MRNSIKLEILPAATAKEAACTIPLPGITICAAAPFRQKRKYMSKRSGQMGQVMLRHDRWIGRYYVDVPGQSSRVRRAVVLGMKSELSKTTAKLKLMNIIIEEGVNTPAHLERSLKPIQTMNDIIDIWIDRRLPQLKVSTQADLPGQLAKHLRPFFGARTLESINTGVVNEWIESLVRKGLQPKTVRNQWKQLRSIVNWYTRQQDAPPRVWSPSLPDLDNTEQRWFTQDESEKLIEAAGKIRRTGEPEFTKGQYRPLFQLTAASGLRSWEISGLHVEDIDFERGVIHVRRSIWNGTEVTTKSNQHRCVFIDSYTAAMLKDHLGARTTGRVFQSRRGTPLDNRIIVGQVLKPLCKQLGIAHGGMHAFRRGRVSHLRSNNVPDDIVQKQVGHSSLRTTSGYTHFTEKFVRDTVERVGSPGLTMRVGLSGK